MRIVRTVLAMLAAAMLCQGCGAVLPAGLGRAAKQLQLPAIVAVEAAVAQSFDNASAAVDSMDKLTPERGQAIARNAQLAMDRLTVARIAYDATLGFDAPPAVRDAVLAARSHTDAAAAALFERLTAAGVPTIDNFATS